ncbi:outer membrane protein assembly factor BamB family protein [Micromonospora sp. NPDC003197]
MKTPSGARRWTTKMAVVAVVLAVVAAGAIAYRVLAPAEELTPARLGYPSPMTAQPGVLGTLATAPLIVDDRLRIHAAPRQVIADQPVDARTRRTPYWSFRRWPAQLTGIVAAGTTVVSQWSDGELVALDARTGRIAWRAEGPQTDLEYAGRRTGAATVYAPPGLRAATTRDGQIVLTVIGRAELRGLDLATGLELWRTDHDSSCSAGGMTTTGGQFVSVDTCAVPQVVEFRDVSTGTPAARWRPADAGSELTITPLGCVIGQSSCAGMRTGTGEADGRGWLVADQIGATGPAAAPALDASGAVLVGTLAVTVGPGGVVARSARDDVQVWRRDDPGTSRILAAQPGRIHLRNEAGELVNLDSATGRELSRFPLTEGKQSIDWEPGYGYAAAGFLAVERLARPVDPDADDDRYYMNIETVLFAGT